MLARRLDCLVLFSIPIAPLLVAAAAAAAAAYRRQSYFVAANWFAINNRAFRALNLKAHTLVGT